MDCLLNIKKRDDILKLQLRPSFALPCLIIVHPSLIQSRQSSEGGGGLHGKQSSEGQQGEQLVISFPLMFLFLIFLYSFSKIFLFSFNSELKKMQNGVISMGLTAATNRVVTEPYIDKN